MKETYNIASKVSRNSYFDGEISSIILMYSHFSSVLIWLADVMFNLGNQQCPNCQYQCMDPVELHKHMNKVNNIQGD